MQYLTYFSQFFIPVMMFYLIALGVCKKQNVYEDFIKGAKDGIWTVVRILPTLIALMLAVNVLRASGFLDFLADLLKPAARKIHFPAPLVPLGIVKLFSGSAATGLLLDIYKEYGTDSTIGKIASVMLSSTETIFYTMSLYFMSVGIRKTRYTLAGCLIATVTGIIASTLLANMF
ncbi:MAG: spore maturation protein [Lachnospiraceae bacterium]